MTGSTITATTVAPGGIGGVTQKGYYMIYFTVTLDASADADFSAYTAVAWIDAKDTSTLAPEDATAYTAGGDIRFTNALNVIAGLALVQG